MQNIVSSRGPAVRQTVISLRDDCLVKFANLKYFPVASFARSYRVTDDAFIAET